MKRHWLVLGILLGMIVVGGAGYLGFHGRAAPTNEAAPVPNTVPVSSCDVTQTVAAPGNVTGTGERVVRMPLNGPLAEVLVKPGNIVEAGQAIARLNRADVLMALAQAQTDVANAQDALQTARSARAGLDLPRTGDLAVERARLDVETTARQLRIAQSNYNQVSGLASDNLRRLNILNALVAAEQAYNRAVANYNWYTGHPSPQDIADADAKLSLANAALAEAQDRLNMLQGLFGSGDQVAADIRAPISGVVLEVDASAGETVSADAALFTLDDTTSVEVAVTVTEEDFPYVNVGQEVQLYFDALPNVQLTGKVSRILPQRAPGDNPLYYVYILPDSVPDKLVDGMSADASILIAERRQVLCLPRALVHASSGDAATVTVWNGTRTETRHITIGLRGDVNVEILSGLNAGELVVSQ